MMYNDVVLENDCLSFSARHHLLLPDGSLHIETAVSSDTGRYTCRVENKYSADEAHAQLTVKG